MDKHLSIAKWVASAVLLLALFEMPIGYYTFVRLTCGPILLFMAFAAFKAERIPWAWCYGLLGLLYNPILPVYLGEKGPWGVINFGTIVCIVIDAYLTRMAAKPKSGRTEASANAVNNRDDQSRWAAGYKSQNPNACIRTHYDNLKVPRHASQTAIEDAFRYLSRLWHPDQHPDDRPRAERIYGIIAKAHEVLADPLRRAEHDLWIASEEERLGLAHSDPRNPEDVRMPDDAFNSFGSSDLTIGPIPGQQYGRIGRTVFFWHLAIWCVCALVTTIGLEEWGGDSLRSYAIAIGVLTFWQCAMIISRLHDIGKSEWVALLGLIPGLNFIMWIVLILIPGKAWPNRYGPKGLGVFVENKKGEMFPPGTKSSDTTVAVIYVAVNLLVAGAIYSGARKLAELSEANSQYPQFSGSTERNASSTWRPLLRKDIERQLPTTLEPETSSLAGTCANENSSLECSQFVVDEPNEAKQPEARPPKPVRSVDPDENIRPNQMRDEVRTDCVFKSVMSDQDYLNCGIKPPLRRQ